MAKIKFNHYYYKMPRRDILEESITKVFQIFVCDYKDLGESYKLWDTAIYNENPFENNKDTKYYPLPKGKLIVVCLISYHNEYEVAFQWSTIRRWTPLKEDYYRNLIDKKVAVEIGE